MGDGGAKSNRGDIRKANKTKQHGPKAQHNKKKIQKNCSEKENNGAKSRRAQRWHREWLLTHSKGVRGVKALTQPHPLIIDQNGSKG